MFVPSKNEHPVNTPCQEDEFEDFTKVVRFFYLTNVQLARRHSISHRTRRRKLPDRALKMCILALRTAETSACTRHHGRIRARANLTTRKTFDVRSIDMWKDALQNTPDKLTWSRDKQRQSGHKIITRRLQNFPRSRNCPKTQAIAGNDLVI
jgi:hypothetical protein